MKRNRRFKWVTVVFLLVISISICYICINSRSTFKDDFTLTPQLMRRIWDQVGPREQGLTSGWPSPSGIRWWEETAYRAPLKGPQCLFITLGRKSYSACQPDHNLFCCSFNMAIWKGYTQPESRCSLFSLNWIFGLNHPFKTPRLLKNIYKNVHCLKVQPW